MKRLNMLPSGAQVGINVFSEVFKAANETRRSEWERLLQWKKYLAIQHTFVLQTVCDIVNLIG